MHFAAMSENKKSTRRTVCLSQGVLRPCSHHRTTQSQSHVPLTSVHTHTSFFTPSDAHHMSWRNVTHTTAPVSAVVTRRQCGNSHTHNEHTGGRGEECVLQKVACHTAAASQTRQHVKVSSRGCHAGLHSVAVLLPLIRSSSLFPLRH